MNSNRGEPQRLLIGNPENRRVQLFHDAQRRCGQPPATVISFQRLLSDDPNEREACDDALRRADWIRIESPGENWPVERALLDLGAQVEAECENAAKHSRASTIKRRQPDPGRLFALRTWHLGFSRLLERLEAAAGGVEKFVNSPRDIALMFDKAQCQQHLEQQGVATPPRLPPVADFAQLREAAEQQGWNRLFVKPSHSSSAAGVIALRFTDEQLLATTAIEIVHDPADVRYYNNLQVRTYHDANEIEPLVNFILSEGAHVEKWLPKAILDGVNFDVRIVTIAGEARHLVVRTSRSPLTNLHLGNQRGDPGRLHERMGDDAWNAMRQMAENAAAACPDSLYLGVDLLLYPGFRKPTVLEVNAFGDLLPGVLCGGHDTYEAELHADPTPIGNGIKFPNRENVKP